MEKIQKRSKINSADLVSVIKVDNLSCEGCVNTIQKNLMGILGVVNVNVSLENHEISIIHKKAVKIDALKEELKTLGYPEAGTTHGFERISCNLKSYTSCAIGRLENLKHEKNN